MLRRGGDASARRRSVFTAKTLYNLTMRLRAVFNIRPGVVPNWLRDAAIQWPVPPYPANGPYPPRSSSMSRVGTKNSVPVTAVLKSRRRSVLPTGSPTNMFSSIFRVVPNVPA